MTAPERHAIRHAIPALEAVAERIDRAAVLGDWSLFGAALDIQRAVVADLRNALDDEPGSSVSVDDPAMPPSPSVVAREATE